jgi:hypothetical protein
MWQLIALTSIPLISLPFPFSLNMTGSHEVRGSIPLSSTNNINGLWHLPQAIFIVGEQ